MSKYSNTVNVETKYKHTYSFELGDVFAVNDAFTVGRRQTEAVHAKTHVQQLPHVTCAQRILQPNNIT